MSEEGGAVLRVPTVHGESRSGFAHAHACMAYVLYMSADCCGVRTVWGAKDVTNPERNRMLLEQCDGESRGRVICHPGAHELPGSGMDEAVQEVVQSIRRLVGRK